jgi:hypothetical protein
MDTVSEALRLLKREAEIRQGLRQSGSNSVLSERELYLIQRKLQRLPAAVQAISFTAAELHRPVNELSVSDVKECR